MDGQMGAQEHNRVSLLPIFVMRLRFRLKCRTVFRTSPYNLVRDLTASVQDVYRSVISTINPYTWEG